LATRKLAGHVALGPLSTGAIRQLLSDQAAGLDLSSTDSLAVAIHKRTGGNPFFATAVVKELTEGLHHAAPSATASQQLIMAQVERCIPASIEALTEQAVAALPLDCQQLVEAASVAGYEVAASAVAAALGRSLPDVENALEQLAREHGLLKLAGVQRWANGSTCGRYEFAHTLYRDSLYRRIAPSRRLQYHLAVARHLAEVTESPPAESEAALAYHFEQGHDFANAVQALAALAWREAMQLGDRSAARHLDHALALARQLPAPIRVERELYIVEQHAMLASCLGDIPGACEAFERLLRSAEEADSLGWQARGLSGLAGILTWLDPLRAIEFGERAAHAANQHTDEPLKTQTRGLLGLLRCLFGSTWQPADAEACLAALPAQIGDSDRRKWSWCSRGAHFHALQGDYERSLAVARKGSQFALSQNDMNDYLSMRYQVSGALFFLGRFGDSLSVLSDAMKIAERNADVGWMIMLGVGQACVEAQCFSYASAIERCEQALAFARRSPVRLVPLELMSHALLALSSVGLGRLDEASAAIRNLESVGPRSFNVRLTALIAKLELAIAHGQIDAIGEAATALLQLTEPAGEPTGIVWARQALALLAFKQKRWQEADSELAQAESVLAKKTAPLAAWRLHRAAAEIYEAQSRLDDAKRARTRCAEVLKGIEDSLIGWDSLRKSFIVHPAVAGFTRRT
jgi:tetratricopeptide (TPR) repeat protein